MIKASSQIYGARIAGKLQIRGNSFLILIQRGRIKTQWTILHRPVQQADTKFPLPKVLKEKNDINYRDIDLTKMISCFFQVHDQTKDFRSP